jgi:integrase
MTHSYHLDHNSICIYASHNGRRYKKATGLTIDPDLWDKKAKTLRSKCKDLRIYNKLRLINLRLEEKEQDVETHRDALKAIEYAVSGREPETKKRPTFWEYFEEWGKRPSSSKRQRGLAVRVIARLMGTDDDWEDIDSAYWYRLQRKMEDEGFSVNYRWNLGARLKVAMHEGYRMKYHRNTDFQEFRSKKEQTDAIALTPDEIEMLWEYRPKYKMYREARDLFLIGYYTGARFSDYSRLGKDNIHDGVIEFVQQKTDDKVVVPVSPRLLELMDRNKGKAPAMNHTVFNRYIKKVARDAGIDGIVQLPKAKMKADGSPTHRWEMVSSHTARRSLLTNLYQSGVSAKDCMAISGHKSISSFERYLKVSQGSSVDKLKENAIFKA